MGPLEISNIPQIKIINYISKLYPKVRVVLKEDPILEFIDDSILEQISTKTGLLKPTLKKYIRNGKYPIFFLKELDNISDQDIFRLIEDSNPLFFSKWK